MIVNSDKGDGRVKITGKQWQVFKKLGFACDTMKTDPTEAQITAVLS